MIALLEWSSFCLVTVSVICLSLAVQWVGLQYVIAVLHTFFFGKITQDPLIFAMDHPEINACSFMEKYIVF